MRCANLVCQSTTLTLGFLISTQTVMLSGCTMPTDEDTSTTISTPDGRASLSVPLGALPEGMTMDDIIISESSIDIDVYAELGVDPPLAVFKLEPDGLQFSEPVTLTVELAVTDSTNRHIEASLVSGEEVESFTDVVSELDLETNTITASMQLTHFSSVWIHYNIDVFSTVIDTSTAEVVIGESSEVKITVTRMVEPGTLLSVLQYDDGTQVQISLGHSPLLPDSASDDTWTLEGDLTAIGPVTPSKVENFPPLSSTSGQTFTLPTQKFECTSQGETSMSYIATGLYHRAMVTVTKNFGVFDRGLDDRKESVTPEIVDSARCVEKSACCVDGQCKSAGEVACLAMNGTHLGSGKTCDANECAMLIGACCIGDGSCVDTTQSLCAAMDAEVGSSFVRSGSVCMELGCETIVGACCIEDGGCVEVTQDACAARSPEFASTFQGVGRSCADGNGGMLCDGVQAGACCFNGVCQVFAKTQCDLIEGTYLGDHFLCSNRDVQPVMRDKYRFSY